MKSSPRGRGIVVTMTGDREGWWLDIKNIHLLFTYLQIEAEYHYDLEGQVVTKNVKIVNDLLNVFIIIHSSLGANI